MTLSIARPLLYKLTEKHLADSSANSWLKIFEKSSFKQLKDSTSWTRCWRFDWQSMHLDPYVKPLPFLNEKKNDHWLHQRSSSISQSLYCSYNHQYRTSRREKRYPNGFVGRCYWTRRMIRRWFNSELLKRLRNTPALLFWPQATSLVEIAWEWISNIIHDCS